jgi:chemotaxis response regulator CheB
MRIFIADGDPLYRALIRFLLSKDSLVDLCCADDGYSVYTKVIGFRPHLLMIADDLTICSGTRLLHELETQLSPETVMVLLSSSEVFSFSPTITDHQNIVMYKHDLCRSLPSLSKNIFANSPLSSQ